MQLVVMGASESENANDNYVKHEFGEITSNLHELPDCQMEWELITE